MYCTVETTVTHKEDERITAPFLIGNQTSKVIMRTKRGDYVVVHVGDDGIHNQGDSIEISSMKDYLPLNGTLTITQKA